MIKSVLAFCFLTMAMFTTSAQQKLAESLIGNHQFGVQFIWDGYGNSTIVEKNGILHFKGAQYSNDKEEYLLMEGTITIIDERNFTFSGSLKLFTKGCCGLLDRDVNYTFRKTGKRAYWRLKEREDLCSQYQCAYYLDIFD